jgi:prepilin-type N-terminal cleavage/methylation domain-containing protein
MSGSRGFTLIETMIVVVVIGLVLATGLPAFGSYRSSIELKEARQQLLEDLREARQAAVTRRSPVVVRFGTPPDSTNITSYTIHVDVNANGVVDAGDRFTRRTMPGGTKISAALLSPTDSVVYDISGILQPGTGGGTLIFSNTRNRRDTLAVSTAGIVYRP